MNISCAFVSIILISLPPPDPPPMGSNKRRRDLKKRLNAGVAEKAKSRRADGGIRWLRDGGDRKERSGSKEKSAEIALSA